MRAVRLHGRQDLRLDDVPDPSPGPGQVKLRNAFSGICGSDLHLVFSPTIDFANPVPHPLTGAVPPQILGHEFSGTVVETGPGVDQFEPGERAAVFPLYNCGVCPACAGGRPNICRIAGFHGLTSDGGGMAEFTTVGADRLHRLPDGVDLRMGALVEPMAVAWHAAELSRVEPGQAALVMGGGAIGIGLWFALGARGVDDVVVCEPSPGRRHHLEQLGARVLDPTREPPSAGSRLLGDGRPFDVAFDAAGVASTTPACIDALAPGGRAVVVAVHERPFDFQPLSMVMKEAEMIGSLAYLPQDFDAVIGAMQAGIYQPDPWTEVWPLEAAPAAMDQLRRGASTKILVAADPAGA